MPASGTGVSNLRKILSLNARLNSSLDLDPLLGIIMNTASALMKTGAASLMLLDEKTGELVFRVALGEKGAELKEKFRVRVGEGISGTVARTGKPLIVNDTAKDARFAKRFDASTGFKTRAILCVPLKAKGKIIGVLQAINPRGRKRFTKGDVSLFEAFSEQAAIALENARLHAEILTQEKTRQELALAHEIQQQFLPALENSGFDVQILGRSIPARSVGGDFYDAIALPGGRTALILGDVSGKGVPAALYMVKAVSDFRSIAPGEDGAPSKIVTLLNASLARQTRRGMFVTLVAMLADPSKGTLTCTSAGHPPLLRLTRKGNLEALDAASGPPAGLDGETAYDEKAFSLAAGDTVMAYTDGLIEARNPSRQEFGQDRLESAFRKPTPSLEETAAEIFRALEIFQNGADAHDDATLLLLRAPGN